jgi:cytochrome c-type biogenesis protein CcmH/NrfG
MQVFIIGTPLETAMALDKKRLYRQIQETRVILDALNGATAWSNHPCVLQYRGCEFWLKCYLSCLCYVKWGEWEQAKATSQLADNNRPDWHTQDYFNQMKRRLYTKNPEHYAQWAHLGKSEENWYYVDGVWRKYVNGKRIE